LTLPPRSAAQGRTDPRLPPKATHTRARALQNAPKHEIRSLTASPHLHHFLTTAYKHAAASSSQCRTRCGAVYSHTLSHARARPRFKAPTRAHITRATRTRSIGLSRHPVGNAALGSPQLNPCCTGYRFPPDHCSSLAVTKPRGIPSRLVLHAISIIALLRLGRQRHLRPHLRRD
jgi:hypothetical protein